MKRYGWIAVAGVAMALQPLVLAAQMDPSQSPSIGQPAPPPIGPNGGQQPVSSSMRESLGAPGVTGRELLDREFLRTAAEEGTADVRLGELAVQKGSPEVKTFAQQIVADHTAFNQDMGTIADSLGVALPGKMGKDDQAEYGKLNGLSGKDFDTEYLTYVLKAHWKKLHEFYMEASVASDPGLASAVVRSMHVMHDHLGMIEKTAKDEGIALPARPPRPARSNATTTPAASVAKQ